MDNDSQPDLSTSRWQFSLRTLFLVFVMAALTLSLLKLGGGEVLAHVVIIGLGIGGSVSLLGSNKAGKTPLVITCRSVAGALTAANLAVYCTDFNVEDAIKIPWREIHGFTFVGAMLGAVAGAVGRWLTSRSTGAAGERGSGE
jgi:hypothetical protein